MRTGNPTRVHNDVCFYFDDPVQMGTQVQAVIIIQDKTISLHFPASTRITVEGSAA